MHLPEGRRHRTGQRAAPSRSGTSGPNRRVAGGVTRTSDGIRARRVGSDARARARARTGGTSERRATPSASAGASGTAGDGPTDGPSETSGEIGETGEVGEIGETAEIAEIAEIGEIGETGGTGGTGIGVPFRGTNSSRVCFRCGGGGLPFRHEEGETGSCFPSSKSLVL